MSSHNEKQKADLVDELNSNLAKQVSYKHNFKLGIVRGVGTAIGATIVAAIILTIFSRVVDTVDDVPLIEDIIQRTNIEERVDVNEEE